MTNEQRQERNKSICELYRSGKTPRDIASLAGITNVRVKQILKEAGVTEEDRPTAIFRPKMIGVLLATQVKQALLKESKRTGESMSSIASKAIVAELERRDVAILDSLAQASNEIDVPLPFEVNE